MGQAEICLAEGLGVMQGEKCPPTTATYWPIHCPSQKLAFHFALCRHFISLYHTISISHANADTHRETQIFMRSFSRSAPLLPRIQCLIRDYIYGEEKGKRMMKYVHMS